MVDWQCNPQLLDEFSWVWAEYDDGSGTVAPEDLLEILLRLLPPLGLGPFATEEEVEELARQLNVPLVDGRLHFHRTAYELVKRCSEASAVLGPVSSQLVCWARFR